jgi:multiple sugar transport system substrate-binding protein
MAKALQTKAGAKWGVGLPIATSDSFQSILPFIWSSGASLTNSDNTKWTFNTPEMISALKYYQSFFAEGITSKEPDLNAGSAEAGFINGSTPMFIAGPSEIGSLAQAGGVSFADKYAVMQIPKQASSTSFVGGSDLVVFKQSKHRDAAWKLVQFLAQADNQVAWHKLAGDLPSVKSAWNDPSLSGDKKLAIARSGADPAAAMKSLQATADSIGTKS